MGLLLATDPLFAEHDPGPGHPERVARLEAAQRGVGLAGLDGAMVAVAPRDATRTELERVHPARHLDRLEEHCLVGQRAIDADTYTSEASYRAAVRAAGTALAATEAVARGDGEAAFCILRPPGHHATADRAMGFCLVNHVAVVAAALADQGERVIVLDWDAHHGNGTQDIFYADPRVLYVSWHEWPLYPGTGRLDETGAGDGVGTTINLPLPAGATGDVFVGGFDHVVTAVAERFEPTWTLVSAGYDAHMADPLTGLALSAGDFAELTARVAALTPGRLVCFLEGGYDLRALETSVAATLGTLAGTAEPIEPPTGHGPGQPVVDAARDLWERLAR